MPADRSVLMASVDERELLRRYREDGDLEARQQLIEQSMPLVRALASRYAYRGELFEDLVQIGAIGLINAIDRFDLERGFDLTAYAVPNIIGEIKRHFRDSAWSVHVPRGLRDLNVRLSRLVEQLTGELGRSPTTSELAKAADVDEERVLEALESSHAYNPLSLSAPSTEGRETDRERLELLAIEDAEYEVAEDRALLARGFDALGAREREILRLTFFEGLTQAQVAQRVGLSQMHVSRLIRSSLAEIGQAIALDGETLVA
jgi:RNA polymerase sigma-B factor